MSFSQSERTCETLRPSTLTFTLNIILLIGIFLSYLPQYYRIISRRSTFGISPYFVLLSVTFSSSNLANILVLRRPFDAIECCQNGSLRGASCPVALLGIWQVAALWICSMVILVLYFMYPSHAEFASTIQDPAPRSIPTASSDQVDTRPKSPSRVPIIILLSCVVHALVLLGPSLVFAALPLERTPPYYITLQHWSFVCIACSVVLAIVQYIPQISMTYQLKRVASLSLPTLCIQTPGFLVLATSLAARFGIHGGPAMAFYVMKGNVWVNYIVIAVFQSILLVLSVYCTHFRSSSSSIASAGTEDAEFGGGEAAGGVHDETAPPADEQTPLLDGERP